MKKFFIDLAVAVMVDAKYVKKLHVDDLREMRSKSIDAMFRRHVTNPTYEIEALTEWLDSLLIAELLPNDTSGSGIYRTDYRERVAIELITLGQALDELSIPCADDSERGIRLIKQTSVATFSVISPQHTAEPYPATLNVRSSSIPSFPPERRVQFRVGPSQSQATAVAMTSDGHANDGDGGITLIGVQTLPFKNGVCDVWLETIEYRLAESESWVFNTMGTLTYGLDTQIYVVNSNEPFKFEGSVTGGLGSENPKKIHLPNGMAFHYDGWLLEDHGYFLWWWRGVEPPGATEGNKVSNSAPVGLR